MEEKMKKILGISIAIFFVTFSVTGAFAQLPNNKRFEFSTSASMLNYKYEGGDTHTWINIPLRIGFFVYKGLEIEPELFLTIPTEDTEYTGILVLGNISYNFKGSKKLVPFILGGAGIGNGPQAFSFVSDSDLKFTAINFGAGIKWFVSDSAAIRIEYRFIKYSGENSYFYNNDRTDNNIYLGVSIFF
jgi:opacity protein-like surface antigen